MTIKITYALVFIFIFALILRFLYFPNNIYFGFDQARDAFATREIINGHLKLIGPPTTFEGLRHGVLYYYLYAPFYLLGKGNPEVVAAFLRILNASGVFLIFAIATILFNKYVGLISAVLFALSFEQTQFAMYLNHPSFAVISIMILFLGLSLLIFKKKYLGLLIALLGLGLSIQFEFILTYLIVTFIVILLSFKKSIPRINSKIAFLGILIFLLTTLTFVIAEIKFNFRSIFSLHQLLLESPPKSIYQIISTYIFEIGQMIKFNLSEIILLKPVIVVILLISFFLSLKSRFKKQLIFLGIWFSSVILVYSVTGGEKLDVDIIQYHPNVGVSLSLIIFVSYLLYTIGKRSNYFLSLVLIILISLGNLSLIQKNNPYGSIPEINAQSFMLLSDEKKVLDFIYSHANGEEFTVKAITLPFYINTTWSYLFEWYGKQKYGYLPIWSGKNALGFPGNLKIEEAQDKLPTKRFLIIEPKRGIPLHLINEFLQEESYFTKVELEEYIGRFTVQQRSKI